ncbi:MAG TPA: NUDIX domain-containing protein [Coleofasciculaceae cyanobacterium]
MQYVKSCGFIVMRTQPQLSFLLMQKPNRYDLPKGHIEAGEDELSCAFRELYEETGIESSHLKLDHSFRFTTNYPTQSPRYNGETVQKTVVIFLGWLQQDVEVKVSEHDNYTWMPWNPPHIIQTKTINPLLERLEEYLTESNLLI